ncbi:hypothetical protein [Sinomonas sp. G460-2]|uniref:hypothetical protein n=1 Tax=Sinomonas sp. G460-2 TaxID=3393464 RepID=UPI0039F11032
MYTAARLAAAISLILLLSLGITSVARAHTGSAPNETFSPAKVDPSNQLPASATAANLEVYPSLVCYKDGSYTWSVTVVDGEPNFQYQIFWYYSETHDDGSGGGTFTTEYEGVLTTGSAGIGTSSTYYDNFGPGLTSVTIYVTVGGITASTTVNCP